MHRVLVAADDGLVVQRSTKPLGHYLTEWLARVRSDPKPTTAAGYERAIKKLDDRLGQVRVRVQDLTPIQIEKAYFDLAQSGLAPRSSA